ncbi:MAG: chromate transporter, partial [Clostridia bacterium]
MNTKIKKKIKDLFTLFAIFFKIGLFSFGGGYAMITLIENEVVNKRKW